MSKEQEGVLWQDRFNKKFMAKGSYPANEFFDEKKAFPSAIKQFIAQEIKQAKQETWDNVKDIYDTTDLKRYVEEAEERGRKEVIKKVLDDMRHYSNSFSLGHYRLPHGYNYILEQLGKVVV